MVEIQLALPDSLHDFIQSQISTGPYEDSTNYLRELVEADKQQQTVLQLTDHPQLESCLQEGLDSDTGRPWTPAVLNELKQQVIDRHS